MKIRVEQTFSRSNYPNHASVLIRSDAIVAVHEEVYSYDAFRDLVLITDKHAIYRSRKPGILSKMKED